MLTRFSNKRRVQPLDLGVAKDQQVIIIRRKNVKEKIHQHEKSKPTEKWAFQKTIQKQNTPQKTCTLSKNLSKRRHPAKNNPASISTTKTKTAQMPSRK